MGIFGSNGVRAGAAYQIDRSLRFNDDDTANLSRVVAGVGTSRRIMTLSAWVKRGNLGINAAIWGFGDVSGPTNMLFLRFDTSDRLELQCYVGGGLNTQKTTTAVFRDPSAWYHILVQIDTTQATAANRFKLYVNGSEVTVYTTNTIGAQNSDIANVAGTWRIGRLDYAASNFFDGYLAEVHFIDGTALTPSSFGETNSDGVWVPKLVSGLTYGTNGFYLSFADNTSTTTLGYDDAGSNDWTLNNFSVTAGAGNDSLTDTPTNNYPVINPIGPRSVSGSPMTTANGNLDAVSGGTFVRSITSSMATPASGKWYFEVAITAVGINSEVGVIASTWNGSSAERNVSDDGFSYRTNGQKGTGGVLSAYGNSFTTNDIIGVALDLDNGAIYFSKNGTYQNSGDPTSGATKTGAAFTSGLAGLSFYAATGGTSLTHSFNFGQRPLNTAAPSGYSTLCTTNLPTPAVLNPSQYHNAVIYTGTGASLGVTGVGFQPDLVWIKGRSGATDHALYDAVRGVQKQIESNTTTDETTETTGLTAFGADGFTVGALAQVNTNTATYVAWCWKESVTPGFDIVTYTGNGSNRTINHNLGAVPKLIIIKARTTAGTDQGWPVYHGSLANTQYMLLNSQNAVATGATYWNSTTPTTTVFSVGTDAAVNTNSDTYVAYLWAEVSGFGKFGSYTGNASADGPFVWCGFRPRFIMVKCTSTTGSWWMLDASRDTYNVCSARLIAEGSAAETSSATVDLLSNGFKLRTVTTDPNASQTYIFAAFASQPFSAPSNAR